MALKALVFLLALAPECVLADEAKIYEHALGEHIIEYPVDTAEVLDSELDGFGGQSHIKVKASEATEIALTFRRPSQTLQYIEHDWIDRSKPASTALALPDTPEFQFGKAKIAEIQKAFGNSGFHYECRQVVRTSGGFLSFLSFEVSSRPDAVYTFVFENSQDLVERNLVDPAQAGLGAAVLVGAIVFRPSYPKDFWCAGRIPYNAQAKLLTPPEQQSFSDFLPTGGVPVETDPWAIVTEPYLMIAKNGAVTWGDRLHIMPDPQDCTSAGIMVWANTVQDQELKSLEGQAVDGSFNILLLDGVHAPIEAPVTLSRALYAPVDGSKWPPFAIGSFVFGPFDFKRLIQAENDPEVFGFSLEFGSDVAGMRDNYWSLEGLLEAGTEAIKLCEAQVP